MILRSALSKLAAQCGKVEHVVTEISWLFFLSRICWNIYRFFFFGQAMY